LIFSNFKLDSDILEGLDSMGYEKPTLIQEQVIPSILEGKDVIACAQTGTGKTAAFIVPLLQLIKNSNHGVVNTIIIVPTRELAVQIDQQFEGFSYFTPISSASVYGGGDAAVWDQQRNAMEQGTDVIIATPGRLISHFALGYVKLESVCHLILDEADRMLDMGFFDDIMKIISFLPKKRQTLLFSATMPSKIREMAKKIMNKPTEISIAISKPAEGIIQAAYLVYDAQKILLVKDLLLGKKLNSVIIFSSTKQNVKNIHRELKAIGFNTFAIHSDLEQDERETVMRDFRNRKFQILVATDVVSRGIDIEGIDLIINFDVPLDAEDYVHRVGRTARAEATGVALTFINEKEQGAFLKIEQLIDTTIHKIKTPLHLGDSPEYNPNEKKKTGAHKPFKRNNNRKK